MADEYASRADASEADFHRWLSDRYRSRTTRLSWTIVALLLATIAVVVVLMLRLNEAALEQEATAADVRRLERQIHQIGSDLHAADHRDERLARCASQRTERLERDLERLLREQISVAAFLRTSRPGCR